MKELADLIAVWRELPPGAPALLATVVATRGSTYRRAGARMLLIPGECLAGTISGGCLESDLVTTAWARTEGGPTLATFDSTGEEDLLVGSGLGCAGVTTALLQRLPEDGGPLALLAQLLDTEEGGTLETVISEGACLGEARIGSAPCERTETIQSDGLTILRERVHAPVGLDIGAEGPDEIALAIVAQILAHRRGRSGGPL